MRIISLIDHSAQLISLILKNAKPSDKVASEYLRSKKYIGSKERKFISETTFFALRNLRYFSFLCDKLYNKILERGDNFDFNTGFPIKSDTKSFITATFAAFESSANSRSIRDAAVIPTELPTIQAFESAMKEAFKSDVYPCFSDIYSSYTAEKDRLVAGEIDLDSEKKPYDFIDTFLSFPNELSDIFHTLEHFTNVELIKLANSFRFPAQVCIRVDTNVVDRDSVLNKMNADGFLCASDPISRDGIILNERRQITEYDLYKSGVIEIQDSASQIVSFALAPTKGSLILDACAGAGGKSLHIAAITGDDAQIISTDTEFMRLKELIKRAEKSGYKSISAYIINENGKLAREDKHSRLFRKGAFDYVLVDAPCSGMGTLRRDPMKKYRTSPKLIDKLAAKQLEILEFYSQYVKPGGVLVYATCSIMPEENRMVIEKFLEKSGSFEPDNLYDALNDFNIQVPGLKPEDFHYTFYPHITNTDGFFVARMRRED